MARGFVIVVGSGRIGNSGVAEGHPAFTESAAIASIPFFMEELRTDITNFTVEDFGEEAGHKVVGQAASVDEVRKLLEDGLKPTVALVDAKFPNHGDGLRAAKIIRKESPLTKIIVFSTDHQEWGEFQDAQWNKHGSLQGLIDNLTNLQH